MKRSFLHTKSFRRQHFSVFKYRRTKNGFTGPKSFRDFWETSPSFPLATLKCCRSSRILRKHTIFIHTIDEIPTIFQTWGLATWRTVKTRAHLLHVLRFFRSQTEERTTPQRIHRIHNGTGTDSNAKSSEWRGLHDKTMDENVPEA